MAFVDMRNCAAHYNEIPFRCIRNAKSILDIGCSNGLPAKFSRYGLLFDKIDDAGDYLGIDIQNFKQTCYHIIQQDFWDFEPVRKYDLVIASHLVEHIVIEKWQRLLDRMYSCVAENGYLVVIGPFKQKETDHSDRHSAMQHKVFDIDRQTFEQFLPNGRYRYSKDWQSRFFREEGESLPYAIFRLIYRVLTFHPYSILSQRRYPSQMIGVWRKKRFEE